MWTYHIIGQLDRTGAGDFVTFQFNLLSPGSRHLRSGLMPAICFVYRPEWIFHDVPWFSMIFHDFPWFSMMFHDVPWIFHGFSMDFPWIFHGFSMIHEDMPCCHPIDSYRPISRGPCWDSLVPQDVAGNPFGQILDERFEVREIAGGSLLALLSGLPCRCL